MPPTSSSSGSESPARFAARAGPWARFLRFAPFLPLAIAIAAGVAGAAVKRAEGEPEWSYYRELVRLSLAESTGPDEKIFGYLPGAKALLAPFVLTEPAGYVAFLGLGVASCVGMFLLLRRRAPDGSPDPWSDAWLSLCMAGPVYLALQNNQLVTFSAFLAFLALERAGARREGAAATALAFAALIKTLPVVLVGHLVASGRLRAGAGAALLLATLSLGFGALTEGPVASVDRHVEWFSQVSEQDPGDVFEGDVPASLDVNQSPLAYATRIALAFDAPSVAIVFRIVAAAGLALAAFASFRGRGDAGALRTAGALWLAWIAFATPFGRYYYLPLCVPVWFAAWPAWRPGRPLWTLPLAGLPLLSLTSGGGNPTYAIYTALTLGLALRAAFGPEPVASGVSLRRLAGRVAFGAGCAAAVALATPFGARLAEAEAERGVRRIFEEARRSEASALVFVEEDRGSDEEAFPELPRFREDDDEEEIDAFLSDATENFFVLPYEGVPDFLEDFGEEKFAFAGRAGEFLVLRERPGIARADARRRAEREDEAPR